MSYFSVKKDSEDGEKEGHAAVMRKLYNII